MIVATIHHGNIPLILTGPTTSRGPKGALDSLSVEILAARASWVSQLAALGYSQDAALPGRHAMFTLSMDAEEESDLLVRVRVEAVGLLTAGEKRRRRGSVAGREVAVGPDEVVDLVWNDAESGSTTSGTEIDKVKRRVPKLNSDGTPVYKVITVPGGSGDRWNVREAILVITDTYFTTTGPSTTVIGTAQTPPNAPSPPPYIWGGYTEPMRGNFPNGWILDDRNFEEHLTGGLWEVTDTFGYYYPLTPA
jgi:hypothetical protein